MKHALVIGGTGMLKNVSLSLLMDYETVTVVARSEEGFELLKNEAGKLAVKLNPLKIDYTDYLGFTNALLKALKDFGDFSLCLCWIHSSAPAASMIAAKVVNQSPKCDFYEILGSGSRDTTDEKKTREDTYKLFENLNYHSIILGYIRNDDNTSRWLTHDEISSGVLDAIKKSAENSVIGIADS